MTRRFTVSVIGVWLLLLLLVWSMQGIAPSVPGSGYISYATQDNMFQFHVLAPGQKRTFTTASGLDFRTYYAPSPDAQHFVTYTQSEDQNVLRIFNVFSGMHRDVPYDGFAPLTIAWGQQDEMLLHMMSGISRFNVLTGEITPFLDVPVTDLTIASNGCCIAYTSFEGLFLLDLETMVSAQLRTTVDGLPTYSQPRFSPDGKHLAYISDSYLDEDHGLFVINLTNEEVTKLTNDVVDGVDFPTWAPNNREIAYTGLVYGQSDIYVVNIFNSKTRQLTNNVFFEQHLEWSD